jgi:hypothetical protein
MFTGFGVGRVAIGTDPIIASHGASAAMRYIALNSERGARVYYPGRLQLASRTHRLTVPSAAE